MQFLYDIGMMLSMIEPVTSCTQSECECGCACRVLSGCFGKWTVPKIEKFELVGKYQ